MTTLLLRLGRELELGSVTYIDRGSRVAFVSGGDRDANGRIAANVLTVLKADITPEIQIWIDAHCRRIPEDTQDADHIAWLHQAMQDARRGLAEAAIAYAKERIQYDGGLTDATGAMNDLEKRAHEYAIVGDAWRDLTGGEVLDD